MEDDSAEFFISTVLLRLFLVFSPHKKTFNCFAIPPMRYLGTERPRCSPAVR